MTGLLVSLMAAATLAGPGTPTPAPTAAPLKVVTSLTTYASIAREIAGDRATITPIAQGDEDPHFVQPRPSFLPLLRDADLFVTTGMDLELWVPTLLDRAGNAKVRENGSGYVPAFKGITILEVPTSLSRAQGDIHVDGNPHIHTDPINGIIIARNILAGLTKASPNDAAYFTAREKDFETRVITATFGEDLVKLVTAPTLYELARTNKVMDFLQKTPYKGAPLMTRLGGWMKTAEAFRGKEMVCYHKEWAYFSNRFGVNCVEYIEAKPGIPPTPRHVQDVIALMREKHIPVLFASNYFDHSQIRDVAAKTGAAAVIVPENTNGAPGVNTYFDLISTWVNDLAKGFAGASTVGASK
ncbi:MAG TPA: metal ABC transporter substrate-binding protein [Gemmatimonadaceae bacterium]|nr:metal ABC transporter substrate-binding protein [Gemmatimonadaceae bacterium]